MGEEISGHDEELEGICFIVIRPLLIIFFGDNIMSSFRNIVFLMEISKLTVNEEGGKWLGNLISVLLTDKDNIGHD